MRCVVAPRTAARTTSCDCCDRYRRCARLPVIVNGAVVVTLNLCSGCLRAGWDAAKTVRR